MNRIIFLSIILSLSLLSYSNSRYVEDFVKESNNLHYLNTENYIESTEERDVDYSNNENNTSNLANKLIEKENIIENSPFLKDVADEINKKQWNDLIEKHTEGENNSNVRLDNNTCSNRTKDGSISDFYYFIPSLRGNFKEEGFKVEFEGTCFGKTVIKLASFTNSQAHFEIETSNSKSLTCGEFLLFATSRIHESKEFFFKGKHNVIIKNLTPDDINEIKVSGFRVLGFCGKVENELYSLYKTLILYLGGFSPKHGHVPEKMQLANVDFIKRYVNLGKFYTINNIIFNNLFNFILRCSKKKQRRQ